MENTISGFIVTNANGNPCYQCKHRCLHCHSSCNQYLDWKAAREESKKKELGSKLAIAYEAERKRSKRYYGR